MAKLTLDAKCAEAVLMTYLKQYFRKVTAGTEESASTVSFGTVIGEFKFKLRCEQHEPSNRLRISLISPTGTGLLLTFKRSSILKQYPFIEKIETTECVVNLEKIEVGGRALTDVIEVRGVQMPGADGAFCGMEFVLKEIA